MRIQQPPIEILGQSIAEWDNFYESNFIWIHKASQTYCQNEQQALILTNKIFLNILLHSPECVINNDLDLVVKEIELLFPNLKDSLSKTIGLDAQRLMKIYYNEN
jgi:hypothetical protein